MDRSDEQKDWSDVTERDHKIKKRGLTEGHLQCLHVSKEVPTRHHYGEVPKIISGVSACSCATLKHLYTHAHTIENK